MNCEEELTKIRRELLHVKELLEADPEAGNIEKRKAAEVHKQLRTELDAVKMQQEEDRSQIKAQMEELRCHIKVVAAERGASQQHHYALPEARASAVDDRLALDVRSVACDLAHYVAKELGYDPRVEKIFSWSALEDFLDADDQAKMDHALARLGLKQTHRRALKLMSRFGNEVAHHDVGSTAHDMIQFISDSGSKRAAGQIEVINAWAKVSR